MSAAGMRGTDPADANPQQRRVYTARIKVQAVPEKSIPDPKLRAVVRAEIGHSQIQNMALFTRKLMAAADRQPTSRLAGAAPGTPEDDGLSPPPAEAV